MTARACTAPTPPRVPSPSTCSVTPATAGFSPGRDFGRNEIEHQRMLDDLDRAIGVDCRDECAFDLRAGGVTSRVRNPVAMWPPSRVSSSSPARSRSNSAPRVISLATSSGPSVTKTRTASSMQRPAPATNVSSMCCSIVSPSAWTHAIPPCAQLSGAGGNLILGDDHDVPRSRHSNAAVKPAMPDPITTMSTSFTQPGASVASRPGSRGSGGRSGSTGPPSAASVTSSRTMRAMLSHRRAYACLGSHAERP